MLKEKQFKNLSALVSALTVLGSIVVYMLFMKSMYLGVEGYQSGHRETGAQVVEEATRYTTLFGWILLFISVIGIACGVKTIKTFVGKGAILINAIILIFWSLKLFIPVEVTQSSSKPMQMQNNDNVIDDSSSEIDKKIDNF